MFKTLMYVVSRNTAKVVDSTSNRFYSTSNFIKYPSKKPNTKIWGVSEDGSIQYQSLTSEYLDDALSVMREDFFPNENICKALGIHNDLDSIEELSNLCSDVAQDGVTIIAVDKATNKVAGTIFNKLQTNVASQDKIFEMFAKTCKHTGSRNLIKYFSEMDKQCNFFDICQVDSLMEIMFIATRSEYKRRGIGLKLSEVSVQLARKLKSGQNVKQSIDHNIELTLGVVPKIVTAVATVNISQLMSQKLGFSVAAEYSYDILIHNGRNFGDYIDKNTPKLLFTYKLLN